MSATVNPLVPITGGGIDFPDLGGNPFTPIGGGSSGGISLPPPAPPSKGPPKPASTAQPNVNSTRAPDDGVEQAGSTLWMRKWKLAIGKPSGGAGSALDLSLLDFEFSVEQQLGTEGWTAKIKVWNLSEDIIGRMAAKQLTQVSLEAGYQSPSKQYGVVFVGLINYFKAGRQDAVDTFAELYATTYDTGVNAATINEALPKGYTTADAVKAVQQAMSPFGVLLGQMPEDFSDNKSPRGRVFFGMARDHLRDIERTEKGKFFIDDKGKLHFLRDTDALKMATIPVLNRKTGLIDVATRTMEGAVDLTCLLNPDIRPGMRIKINNKDVTSFQSVDVSKLPPQEVPARLQLGEASFKADGIYKCLHVRHQGQNRGNPWYSHITTETVNPEQQAPALVTKAG